MNIERPLGYCYLAPSLKELISRLNTYTVEELEHDIIFLNSCVLTQRYPTTTKKD